MLFVSMKARVISLLIVLSCFSTTSVLADEGGASKFSAMLGTFAKSLADAAEASKQRAAARRGEQLSTGAVDQQQHQWFNSNPLSNMSDADKQLMANGMWHDPKTGLTWMRCILGQKWNGSGCTRGENESHPEIYTQYGWEDAALKVSKLNFGGYSDWRIPTVEELYNLYNFNSCLSSSHQPTGYEVKIPKNGGQGIIIAPPRCDGITTANAEPNVDPSVFQFSGLTPNYSLVVLSSSYNCQSFKDYEHAISTWIVDLIGSSSIFNCEYTNTDQPEQTQHRAHVLMVRGGQSTGEFENMLAVANKHQDIKNRQQEAAAKGEAKRAEEYRQQNVAWNKRVTAFQKSVKPGDRSAQGLVIEVRGDVIRVQATETNCIMREGRYGTGTCLQWERQLVEKWIQRTALTP